MQLPISPGEIWLSLLGVGSVAVFMPNFFSNNIQYVQCFQSLNQNKCIISFLLTFLSFVNFIPYFFIISHYSFSYFLFSILPLQSPYQVNLLIAGWDKEAGPGLYFMDYLGSMVKVPFAAHGYSSYFALSTLDCHYQ